jgi:hypothetical protein
MDELKKPEVPFCHEGYELLFVFNFLTNTEDAVLLHVINRPLQPAAAANYRVKLEFFFIRNNT